VCHFTISLFPIFIQQNEDAELPVTDKSVYMTVAKETEAVKQLDRAVALWES
jgi:hypothetical protein